METALALDGDGPSDPLQQPIRAASPGLSKLTPLLEVKADTGEKRKKKRGKKTKQRLVSASSDAAAVPVALSSGERVEGRFGGIHRPIHSPTHPPTH